MRFREHRGGLAESLETTVEVADWAALEAHVRKILKGWRQPVGEISIEPYGRGDDDRIGWKDVHIVMVQNWGPVGFVEWPAGRKGK